MVISLEQDLLFQLEQHKAHLHINVSAVEETSAGFRSGRGLQKWSQMWAQPRDGKGASKGDLYFKKSQPGCLQADNTAPRNCEWLLAVSPSIRASRHPKKSLGSKPQRISLSTQGRVTLWFSPLQRVAENKNMSLKRDEMNSPRIAPGGGWCVPWPR